MPTVPQLQPFQQGIAVNPSVQVQAPQGPQAGQIAAEQGAQMGRALQSAGNDFARIATDMQHKADHVRIDDARNQLDKIKLDRQLKAYTLEGRTALERPDGKSLMDEEAEELDKEAQRIAEGLGNDRQKQMFKSYAGQLGNQYRGQVGSHVLQQQKKFDIETDKSKLDVNYQKAQTLYALPGEVESAKAGVLEVFDRTVKRQGLDPEKDKALIETMRQEMLSPMHAGVLRGMMKTDPAKAEEYYKANSAEMSRQAKETLNEAITQNAAEIRGTEKVQELVGSGGEQWSAREIDRQLAETFKGKPAELKAARAELRYQDGLRDEAKKELDTKYMGPVETLVADAMTAGRMVTKQEIEKYVKPINGYSPEHYRKAAELVDKHNDEIRREQHEATVRARSLAEMSGDKALNFIAIKNDMAVNPEKYKNADMREVLRESVTKGQLSASQVTQLGDFQIQIRKPAKQHELAVLQNASQYLDTRLAGTVVDGMPYTKLPKEKQHEVKTKALQTLTPLLDSYQASTGDRADNKEVQGVIDSIFTTKKYRSTFMGFTHGDTFDETTMDAEGAPQRLGAVATANAVRDIPAPIRARIESALRSKNYTVTNDLVLQYYKAGNK